MFICPASFRIKGLCLVLNKNWLSYACPHLRQQVCLQRRVYMPLGGIRFEDVPLGSYVPCIKSHARLKKYCRWLESLLFCLCDVFQALINSLVCWFQIVALGIILFEIAHSGPHSVSHCKINLTWCLLLDLFHPLHTQKFCDITFISFLKRFHLLLFITVSWS